MQQPSIQKHDRETQRTLYRLYKLNLASERGLEAVAEHVRNRSRLLDSSLAGAFLGVGLRVNLAFVAAIGIRILEPAPFAVQTFLNILIGGALGGTGFGAILDWIMGYGIQEEDEHRQSTDPSADGRLLMVATPTDQEAQISHLLQHTP